MTLYQSQTIKSDRIIRWHSGTLAAGI